MSNPIISFEVEGDGNTRHVLTAHMPTNFSVGALRFERFGTEPGRYGRIVIDNASVVAIEEVAKRLGMAPYETPDNVFLERLTRIEALLVDAIKSR